MLFEYRILSRLATFVDFFARLSSRILTALWLWLIGDGVLSSQKLVCTPRAVCVVFVKHKVALGQVLLRVLRCFPARYHFTSAPYSFIYCRGMEKGAIGRRSSIKMVSPHHNRTGIKIYKKPMRRKIPAVFFVPFLRPPAKLRKTTVSFHVCVRPQELGS
jgi:hypothetical protein